MVHELNYLTVRKIQNSDSWELHSSGVMVLPYQGLALDYEICLNCCMILNETFSGAKTVTEL